MMPLWLIPVIPLAGFAVNALLGTKLGKAFVSAVGVGAAGLTTAVAFSRIVPFLRGDRSPIIELAGSWIAAGSFSVDIAFRLDLSA